jgi:hypothetical protein
MAAHTRVEREFALVNAGCEACAPCAVSEAIETCGGGGDALAGLTVKAITPVASAAADVTAKPRLGRHLESRRSMRVRSVENCPAHLADARGGT